jgi:two-component system KDP operon response regulator KdpE
MNHDPTKPSNAVLVIDDEPQIRRLLRVMLEANGYKVFDAATGRDGIVQAAQCRPEIILLDLGLPDLEGVEVLKRIREWSRVPVIILSVRDREHDKIAALDAGADDFVTKPFGSGELLARLRTTLRRSQPPSAEAIFRTGNLEINLSTRSVRKNGQEVKLTPTEYALLRRLVVHAGKVLTHRQLLTEIWGPNAVEQTQYLRVHVAHLREKLEDNAARPQFLITEPAVGYRAVRLDEEMF